MIFILIISEKRKKEETAPQFAYRVLKESIMSLHIKPGELISETEVAKSLELSRTPVREAIFQLKKDKLVDVYPNRGSYVSYLDPNLIEEAHFMRRVLETEVVKLSCKEFSKENLERMRENLMLQKKAREQEVTFYEFFLLDNEFHQIIFSGCGKNNIWEYITSMSSHLNRIRLLDVKSQETAKITHECHEKILKIIENKEIDEVEKYITDHTTGYKKRYTELYEKYPEYFKVISES